MFLVISNIPHTFQSKDLRNYFSLFIKKNAFEFFHFNHRSVEDFLNYLNQTKLALGNKCANSIDNTLLPHDLLASLSINEPLRESKAQRKECLSEIPVKENKKNDILRRNCKSALPSNSFFVDTSKNNIVEANAFELETAVIVNSAEESLSNVSDFLSKFRTIDEFKCLVKKIPFFNEEELTSFILSNDIFQLSEVENIKKNNKSYPHPFSLAKITEKKIKNEFYKSLSQNKISKDRRCCFVKVNDDYVEHFKKLYHKKFWVTEDGSILACRCLIFNIEPLINIQQILKEENPSLSCGLVNEEEKGKTNYINVENMNEFHACPSWPHGNVGTSDAYFKVLYRQGCLPINLMSKLGWPLELERKKTQKKQVLIDFETAINQDDVHDDSEIAFTGKGDFIPGYGDVMFNKILLGKSSGLIQDEKESSEEMKEWEKFEAFHQTVIKDEKSKESFFEPEIELVWKKGGPGLFFYRDGRFWRVEDVNICEEEPLNSNGDFNPYLRKDVDENTNDFISKAEMDQLTNGEIKCSHFSKDVTCDCKKYAIKYSVFQEETNVPQKIKCPPRKTIIEENLAINLRANSDQSKYRKKTNYTKRYEKLNKIKLLNAISKDPESIGTFEQYTRGIGSRLLESQGWKAGQGLGKNKSGSPFPVDSNGQHYSDKRGLGYFGKRNEPHQRTTALDGTNYPQTQTYEMYAPMPLFPTKNITSRPVNNSTDLSNVFNHPYGYPVYFKK